MKLSDPFIQRRRFLGSKSPYLSCLMQYVIRPHKNLTDLSVASKAAISSMRFFSTPSDILTKAACEVLDEAGVGEKKDACDILERELMRECQELASLAPSQPLFMRKGHLGLNELFASRIAQIGLHGKKLSQEILQASFAWTETYRIERKTQTLFKLWIDPERHPYYCRFLKLLAEVLWKDRAAQQYEKSQKQISAITQSVYRPLARLLSPKVSLATEKGGPALYFGGKLLAQTAGVDTSLLGLIEKGAKSFGSIYHHKLLRYQCKKGFENWLRGVAEPRSIRLNGGATQLAEELGFRFKEAPSILKALLYAQAYMDFIFDDGSSANLISLRKYRTLTTKREEGLEIILSCQLMPYYTFQTNKQRRLLIPIPEFPAFVSAPQFFSGQALLQMLILEEFTLRSIELAQQGFIEISSERWLFFFQESALPESVFFKTKESWIKGNFMVEVAPGRYSLGEAFQKELRFLEAQGDLRTERQRQGRLSVRRRAII